MSHRNLFLIGFALCGCLLAAAFYFQHIVGLEPCPLCILQRVAFIVFGIIALVAFWHNPRGRVRRLYGGSLAAAAGLGAAVAARHVYLQNLPADRLPECGPGLAFILDAFPLLDAFGLILRGSGECAEVQWTWLGLTMPMWSLVWLLSLGALAVFIIARRD